MREKAILVILILLTSSIGTYVYFLNTIDDEEIINNDIEENIFSVNKNNSNIPQAAWNYPIGKYLQGGMPHTEPDRLVNDGTYNGAPLGGFGSGSIGRSHRGEFSRWHLDVGNHIYNPDVDANQFSVYIDDGDIKKSWVMNPKNPSPLGWNGLPNNPGTYHALYPRAWYEYSFNGMPLELIQEQFSPIIPNNYKETSFPVGVFEWQLLNPTEKNISVSIMFSWQNMIFGGDDEYLINEVVEDDETLTICLTRDAMFTGQEYDGEFAISTKKSENYDVSYTSKFDIKQPNEVWTDFSDDGRLSNLDLGRNIEETEIGAAIAVSFTLGENESIKIPFSLAWDLPIVDFGALNYDKDFVGGRTQWYKYYTEFYGISGRNSEKIAKDALGNYTNWREQIIEWQKPILEDDNRPDWFKGALFNELYYLVDGGTFWSKTIVPGQDSTYAVEYFERDYGRFGYLETYDYRMYNTFDVHFYVPALTMLWPELQKTLVMDFIETVFWNDTTLRSVYFDKSIQETKPYGAVPHDVGNPLDDPWIKQNSYQYQDSNIWKDLNAKLVMQIYRDYVLTGDDELIFSDFTWDAIYLSLEYLHGFDTNGNHLPNHAGIPDQTYDTLPMANESSYTSSLWISALEAAKEIANMRGDTSNVTKYSTWITESKEAFEELLWTGEYYRFDANGGNISDSIMSDQLAGQWYAYQSNLEPIAPIENIESALQKIYNFNVMKFGGGVMGAVNVMRSDGTVETAYEQSKEVWTGTTYGLAATMYHAGLIDEAFATAFGVYNVTYNMGYWFRTPEAYLENGDFRASMYMRPLSIWGLELAISNSN